MLLEVNDLRGGYGNGDVVKGVSLSLDKGEILSVLGPNGCGKTTLFRLLLGFLSPSGGNVLINGKSTDSMTSQELAGRIAYIPQSHTPVFSYTAMEIVLMGRASHLSAFDHPRSQDQERALEAMELLNLLPLAHQKYTALSGGQRQMVLIARAICQDAELFIMDEPGASLDYANQQLLMNVIQSLAQKGYGIILSTHSPEQPFTISHKALLMKNGQTAAFGTPSKAITPEILETVYGLPMDVVTIKDRHGRPHTLCIPLGSASSGIISQ